MASCLAAFLEGNGVAATAFRRFPAINNDDQVAEQMTLRQLRPLTPSEVAQEQEQTFRLDLCPDGDEVGCY